MGSVYRRFNTLWIRFKGPDKRWTQRKTDYKVGDEKLAKKLLEKVEDRIEAGAEFAEPDTGIVTVAAFAKKWLAERRALGNADSENDERRLRLHVLPTIGHIAIERVRPKHLIETFQKMKLAGKASRTRRNVYSVVRALFRDAQMRDVIEQSPAILTKYQLGTIEDAKPEWRRGAIFTRTELELLIGDERIPEDRHVWYALIGLAGLRPGEAAALRWRDFEPDAEPLGRLFVSKSNLNATTKTHQARAVPVHPVLAAMLGAWKLHGWSAVFGKSPDPDDLLVPFPERRYLSAGSHRNKNTWGKDTREDLPKLGLRTRRAYDLRRTFITLCRSDGARKDLLKQVTHAPNSSDMLDLYSSFEWKTLCDEVSKLRIRRGPVGVVIPLVATQ